jgi:short-subunit dehydrogenase
MTFMPHLLSIGSLHPGILPAFRSLNMDSTSERGTALITGASTGIGAVYAERLAQRGYDLILVARNAERLEALARQIRARTHRSVETHVADLTNKADLAAVETTLRTHSRLSMLVNNAGVAGVAPLLASNVDQMEAMIALNTTVLMRLSYAAAPAFVAREGGAIVNIASIVALAPEILNGVYGATKAFVLAFSQSLLHELSGKGIRVQVVLPGATRTPLWTLAGVDIDSQLPGSVMAAEDMVDAALAGFDLGEFATIPALPDVADWNAFEAARRALGPNLSRAEPAERYRVAAH